MHYHLDVIHALVTFAMVIVVGFFWRVISAHNHGNAIGQAMAFVY
jgi:hypothetical protein